MSCHSHPERRTRRLRSSIRSVALIGLVALGSEGVSAAAPPVLGASPDVTVALGAANVVTADHQIVLDNLSGIVAPGDVGPLPEGSDLVGVARTLGGASLLALDTTVALSNGLVARRGDVVAWDGVGHSRLFDAKAAGVPSGVRTDAVSIAPTGLLLSFDVDVALPGGLAVADEDLVRFDGTAFRLAFDGSAHGLDPALDVDAAQDLGGGTFLLSFDTHGIAGDLVFADEDIVFFTGTTFTRAFDGSVADADWIAADLDALAVPEPPGVTIALAGSLLLASIARCRTCARLRRVMRAPLPKVDCGKSS